MICYIHAMSHFKKALMDPTAFYKEPKAVLVDSNLTKKEKLQILRQWEYDARELMVAEEENMLGDASSSSMLSRILKAIHELDPSYDGTKSSGTKHGGFSSETNR
ncbi:hypothetical protein [Coxiella burnetii]|uniref:hypothetical protein n=1 Tax=Coxiella burnetii TaxID=777 RepID=UPI000183D15F|nr:hypothetical protein [Coxiella burnetii]ACJ18424.1 hypothetical cytosolic protein [Coxiella burnetii CbuG_Q212]ATN66803.1 hypothetical protein AYM17_05245 [Coxiella burnetii]OYK86129.1 hypothetical protein CbuQ229_05475 [Coxiella burnetii]